MDKALSKEQEWGKIAFKTKRARSLKWFYLKRDWKYARKDWEAWKRKQYSPKNQWWSQ